MYVQSFTGPSRLTRAQEREAIRVLESLQSATCRRSGCAFGLDTLAALSAPPPTVHLFVPDGLWHNELLVRDLVRLDAQVTFVTGGYRRRNEQLVTGSDELHAFVTSSTYYRSGEWMTINIAKSLGIPVIQHLLPA